MKLERTFSKDDTQMATSMQVHTALLTYILLSLHLQMVTIETEITK